MKGSGHKVNQRGHEIEGIQLYNLFFPREERARLVILDNDPTRIQVIMVMALRNDRDNDDVMRMLMYSVGGRRKIGRKGNKGDLSGASQPRIIISLSHKTR